MKRNILAIMAMVMVISGCSSSDENLDDNGVPLPQPALATRAGMSLETMGEGYWIFKRKCLECHEVRIPQGELIGQWHPVVERMVGNAGLSTSEESKLVNYLRAAKLKLGPSSL